MPNFGQKRQLPKGLLNILSVNLKRLLDEHDYIKTPRQLAARAKVGSRTIDRILKGEHAGQLDTLEAIANALECAAWQLLVPDLNPKEMPVLATPTGPEAALYAQFRALREQIKEETGQQPDKPKQSKAKSR